jgi:hypothetical protein
MSKPIMLTQADYNRLMEAVAEAGSVDALLARSAARRRTRIEPRSASEVVALVEAGVVSRAEGRRYLGLRGAPPARRPR